MIRYCKHLSKDGVNFTLCSLNTANCMQTALRPPAVSLWKYIFYSNAFIIYYNYNHEKKHPNMKNIWQDASQNWTNEFFKKTWNKLEFKMKLLWTHMKKLLLIWNNEIHSTRKLGNNSGKQTFSEQKMSLK